MANLPCCIARPQQLKPRFARLHACTLALVFSCLPLRWSDADDDDDDDDYDDCPLTATAAPPLPRRRRRAAPAWLRGSHTFLVRCLQLTVYVCV